MAAGKLQYVDTGTFGRFAEVVREPGVQGLVPDLTRLEPSATDAAEHGDGYCAQDFEDVLLQSFIGVIL
jgi:hypothetical protein